MPDFIAGQVWLSEAEPNLGLGLVVEADPRRVGIRFPAIDELRTYAVQSAPLSRVRFAPGDRVEDIEGDTPTVIEVHEQDGLLDYTVRDVSGQERRLSESELNPRMRLGRPKDRMFAVRLDQDHWFDLRRQTWEAMARSQSSGVHGLCGARMSLIPHQLYIADEVSSRHAPRVLLADEVGLGKTIEAGLILHRLLLTGRAQRVLIVTPEPLLHQWLVEMSRRFNLSFSLFDEERIEAGGGDANPFLSEQRVLCSLSLLTSVPAAARAALDGEWDLLIVDEAHHLHWTPEASSLEYDLIQALAEQSPGVLLLTATPEQLGRSGHFARLRLLDPDRFHDYDDFLEEEQHYEPVGQLASALLDEAELSSAQTQLLEQLLGADWQAENALAALLDRHGTGRVLFRNTRSAIQGFPGRQLQVHELPWPEAYRDRTSLTPEQGLDDWARQDPRVAWLLDLLRENRPDKVLVICALAETARQLSDSLLRDQGLHAALFHEDMSIVDRDRAAAWFADPEGAQVLVCSEIGSEGRNFQFSHHLVLFDLPLDPDLLEQRIGRLDRIGQRETIQIHVPVLEGGAGERLMAYYRDGLNAFAAPCPVAGSVTRELADELQAVLDGQADSASLLQQASSLAQELAVELEQGRDRLLELHSHRPAQAEKLAEQVREHDRDRGLQDYLLAFWDAFGVEHEPGMGRSTVIKPGRHMRHGRFPGLPADGLTLSFERDDALAHEDRAFLTWEHPMVTGAMDMLAGEELGVAAMSVVQHADFRPGTPLLECLYVLEAPAPAGLHIQRYLPPTVVRLVLNAKGEDLAADLPPAELKGRCLFRERNLAESLLGRMRPLLEQLLDQAALLAEKQADPLREQALEEMQAELQQEWQRLAQLSQVNPNVRQDELDYLETRREVLEIHLRDARVRLDALRVLVMS